MNEGEIRQAAAMYAINAEVSAILVTVEGMKAQNKQRDHRGESLAYPEESFFSLSEEIMSLKDRLLNEI